MKKSFLLITLCALFAVGLGTAIAGDFGPSGPAPNSGDGVSDGSGMDSPNGPNGSGTTESGNGPSGPAPNSGDGVSDGSGMDSPSGPHGN